jgi:hypothetical protein
MLAGLFVVFTVAIAKSVPKSFDASPVWRFPKFAQQQYEVKQFITNTLHGRKIKFDIEEMIPVKCVKICP